MWGPARSNTAAKIYCFDKKKASRHRKEKRNTSCFPGVVWEASQSAIYKAHVCHICTLAHRKQGDENTTPAKRTKMEIALQFHQVHQCHLVHQWSLPLFKKKIFSATISHQDVRVVGSDPNLNIWVWYMNKYCAVLYYWQARLPFIVILWSLQSCISLSRMIVSTQT